MAAAVSTAIERLQGPSNYGPWCTRMKLLLQSQSLWDAVSGDAVDVARDINAKALNVIASHVEDHYLSVIDAAGNAREAWLALRSQHISAVQVREQDLRSELMHLSKRKDESVQRFIARAKRLAGDVRNAGGQLDDSQLVTYIVNALKRSRDFSATMHTSETSALVSEHALSLDRIESIMMRVEADIQRQSGRSADGMFTSAMSAGSAPLFNSVPRFGVTRPMTSFLPGKVNPGGQRDVCNYCGKVGHWKKDCRKFKRDQEQKRLQEYRSGQHQGGAPPARGNEESADRPGVHTAVAFGISPLAPPPLPTLDVPSEDQLVHEHDWLVDSGASVHITPNPYILQNYKEFPEQLHVTFGNNTKLPAFGCGSVSLKTEYCSELKLIDVWWVPQAAYNFLSVSKAARTGINVKLNDKGAELSIGPKVFAKATIDGNDMYFLRPLTTYMSADAPRVNTVAAATSSAPNISKGELLHERYGHLHYGGLAELIKYASVDGIDVTAQDLEAAASIPCEACILAKQTKNYAHPMPSSAPPATGPLDIISMDLIGPVSPASLGRSKYIATVIDHFSGYAEVFPLQLKSDTAAAMFACINRWENHADRRVKVVRSDNGGEYISGKLQAYFADKGIQHQLTAPYSPEQNGTAERFNRTLVERARAMLISSGLPTELWAEAVCTSAYLHNIGDAKGGKTPWELFYGVKPDISHLRVFGSMAYPLIPARYRVSKMEPVAWRGHVVGYQSKAYRIYLPVTERIVVSKDVKFIEMPGYLQRKRTRDGVIPFDFTVGDDKEEREEPPKRVTITEQSDGTEQFIPIPAGSDGVDAAGEEADSGDAGDADDGGGSSSSASSQGSTPSPPPAPAPTLRRSDRIRQRPGEWWKAGSSSGAAVNGVKAADIPTPVTLEEALSGSYAEYWRNATEGELEALRINDTWELVELPPGCTAVPCKWVYKVKVEPDGSVRFKARLVAKGFAQRPGVDFFEVYAPVSKYATLRFFLAIVVIYDLEIRQADFTTAFLNAELEETVYMRQPPGFHEGGPNIVCRLKRSLYGLKQAPRAWYESLAAVLKTLGFKPSEADAALFIGTVAGVRVYMLIYVDDCLLAAPTGMTATLDRVIADLNRAFKIKDMGEPSVYLGLEINRDRVMRTLTINQPRYITDLLRKFDMLESRTRRVPLDDNKILTSTGKPLDLQESRYGELVGSLLYLSITTRLDIAYAVGALARYTSAPTLELWHAAQGVLRYLNLTANDGITYVGNGCDLVGYCDSDFAGNIDTRKSTTGYVFKLADGAISWCSKLQATVAVSTCEAEYIAAGAATKEALWLRKLADDFNIDASGLIVHIDNTAALSLITNASGGSARTKHIDVQHHFVRERVARGELDFKYCETSKQAAEIFTKPLDIQKFEYCKSQLGMAKRDAMAYDPTGA